MCLRSANPLGGPSALLLWLWAAVMLLPAATLAGQTLYWDTNGTTAGAGTANGTWSTGGGAANNRWNTISGGGSGGTIGKWTSGADAVFSAGTDNTGNFTVTLAANQNVSSITVEEGNPTFNNNSITFNDASPDFTVASGSTATVNSGIAGTNGLNKLGAGTLIFATSDKAYTGTTTISAGILQLNFNQTFDTVNLAGGELLLNSASTTITNLNLTANSIIDFATAATLTVTNLNLNGFSLTVQNWANASDFFFATNWTGAVPDTSNVAPMNQVAFDGYSASDTKWLPYGSHEVTPVPEPATYGALLLGALTGFFVWRRLVRRPAR
jgi:autotransporter-associated beta strand protein